jgi:hypothetical protein
MHDYTAGKVHQDRMRDLTREADEYRLAKIAKEGLTRRNRRALLRRWLSLGVSRLSRETRHSPESAKPAGLDSGAGTTLSVSSTGDR